MNTDKILVIFLSLVPTTEEPFESEIEKPCKTYEVLHLIFLVH